MGRMANIEASLEFLRLEMKTVKELLEGNKNFGAEVGVRRRLEKTEKKVEQLEKRQARAEVKDRLFFALLAFNFAMGVAFAVGVLFILSPLWGGS